MASTVFGDARTLAPRELLQLAEDLYSSFEPARVTVDSHAEQFFSKQRVCEGDRIFAEQVLYGCTRYKKLLDAFITALYYHESANLLRADRTMYTCFAYLALLRLDDLTFPQFRRLIFSNDAQKMLCFIRFAFDPELLTELCRDEWLQIYDNEYVDALIQQMASHESEVQEVVDKLDQKVTLAKQKEDEDASPRQKSVAFIGTIPTPFNLTVSRPRPLPQVEELPPPIKARPAPPRRFGPTAEEKAIQAAFEEGKKRRESRMADVKPFHLRVLERPSNLEQVRAELEERRRQEETYEPAPPRPVPAPPAADVKYNTAAILREEFLYQKRAEKEAKALKNIEEALRDGQDYEIWRIDQRAAEEAARAVEAERKREEARAAEEAGRRAREEAVARNVQVADQQREEAVLAAEALKEQREKEKELNVHRKEKVVGARVNIRVAKEKCLDERKHQAEELARQRTDHEARRALDQEEERRRKAELVRQIREKEAAAALARGEKSQAEIIAQTSNLGLMEEMSIQELRERLAAVTEEQRRDEEGRRLRILADKSAKDESILQKAARLQHMREQNKQVAVVRRARQAQAVAQASRAAQARVEAGAEGALARLQQKRERQAAEDARLADEIAAVQAQAKETQKKVVQDGALRLVVSAQGHRLRTPLRATASAGAVGKARRGSTGFPPMRPPSPGSSGAAGEPLQRGDVEADDAAAVDAAAAEGPGQEGGITGSNAAAVAATAAGEDGAVGQR